MDKKSLPAVQSPHVLDFISHSAAQTVRIGQRLGETMQAGDVLLLLGNIGTGKTQFIKGVVQGLDSSDLVTSPTFVLVNEYRAGAKWRTVPIYHLDLYRIDDPSELTTIGVDEIWNESCICLIEWAERAEGWLPGEHLALHIQHLDETKRVLRFVPHGERYISLVELFKQAAFG
jgi:tRNA threonylcarbamoyladenosine biosynthesis protein TsaE